LLRVDISLEYSSSENPVVPIIIFLLFLT